MSKSIASIPANVTPLGGEQPLLNNNELHLILGRLQMAGFYSKLSAAAELSQIQHLMNSSTWKGQSIKSLRHGGVIELTNQKELCEHALGKSQSAVYEQLKTLDTLGTELYDAAAVAGISRTAFRSLRSMPEEERVKLGQEIAETTDAQRRQQLFEEVVGDLSEQLKEAREQTKDAKALAEKCEAEHGILAKEVVEWEGKFKERHYPGPFPEPVARVRALSAAYSDQAIAGIDDMHRLLNDAMQLDLPPGTNDPARMQRIGIESVGAQIKALAAKVGGLLADYNDQFGEDELEEGVTFYTPDERARRIRIRNLMLAEYEGNTDAVSDKVRNEQPRGVGRPPKTKSTAKRK